MDMELMDERALHADSCPSRNIELSLSDCECGAGRVEITNGGFTGYAGLVVGIANGTHMIKLDGYPDLRLAYHESEFRRSAAEDTIWCRLRGKDVPISECVGGCPAPEQREVCAAEWAPGELTEAFGR